jgi:hypothetical protein
MKKVSIIIPVIRPDKAARCIEAIHGLPEASLVWENGYGPYAKVVRDPWNTSCAVEVLSEEDVDRIGCPQMVKRLTEKATGDYICFLGDDAIPQDYFLRVAIDAMSQFPAGVGVVGLNDESGRDLPTHWLAHRDMLPMLGGDFFCTEYTHCFADNELMERAKELGRYVYCKEAIVKHDHPMLKGEKVEDDDLKRVYKDQVFLKDRWLFAKRRANGWKTPGPEYFKLAIGFPLVDQSIPVQFFTSYACLDKPDKYALYLPKFPHGPFMGNIADARNSIVEQALNDGCTHLLMCDTDQIYPHDTLTRLLAHQKDVVGVRVHRRWPPFDVILYRGDIGQYKHVPDSECFSGDLVEVDATGTGCLLFDMRVFTDVPRPWFALSVHTDGKPVGEDIYFCSKARTAGIRIFVDTDIEVGHLSLHEIGRGTYEIFKKLNKFAWAE